MRATEVKSKKYNLIGGGLPISCKISNGKIVPALSVGGLETSCPDSVRFAAFSHNLKRVVVVSGTYTFLANEGGMYLPTSYESADAPFVIEHKSGDISIFEIVFNKRFLKYRGTSKYLMDYPADIGAGIYKNGRVFGVDLTDKTKIRWSGEGGMDDWTEKIDGAGWLCFEKELGVIYRLYELNGQIAALREYGVSILSAYGAPENFKEVANVKTPPTYAECAAACGGKLYIYTVEGMYALSASGAERLDIGLTKEFDFPVYATTYEECVFFAGTHKVLGRGVILVYNTKDKSAYFIDADATAMCVGTNLYAFINEGAATLTAATSFTYESKVIGGFSKRVKTLESIFADCEKGIDIKVESDRGSRIFKGVKGPIKTHMGGSFFKVSVFGADCEIRELTANVEYY